MTSTLNTQPVLAMKGAGYYSQRTQGAKHVIDGALPMVNAALDALPADLPVIRIADYGAADGGTSQAMWHAALTRLRERGDKRPVELVYTDLASNDFSVLFRSMQGFEGDKALALQDIENVFVHGCGTGFHRQLMADESLALGFSATAMHYVSEKPLEIKDHVHMVGASEAERAAFEKQAADDWSRILRARERELMAGGRFIVLNFGIDEEGRYLGNTDGVNMFGRFNHHWGAMKSEGTISAEEFERATFAQHYRTLDEFKAPVEAHGFDLLSAKSQVTDCPYKVAFQDSETMSTVDYAASLIPTTRSWSETVFRTALTGRDEAEIDGLVDQFYGAYEAEVAADPAGHAMDYVHIVMEMEKRG